MSGLYSNGSFDSQSATDKKADGKAKSGRAKVDVDSNSNFQISIPLSSASTSTSSSSHSGHSHGNATTPLFGPAPDHGASLPLANRFPSSASYQSHTTGNSTPSSSSNYTPAGVNWQSGSAGSSSLPYFNGHHSPIASLAPHSSHMLPFTTLGGTEDISIHNSSSLPYYYPPEWNRDEHELPEWTRVIPTQWSRNDFMHNPSLSGGGMVPPPSYSMDNTNSPPQQLSPSLLSSLEEPLDLDLDTMGSSRTQSNTAISSASSMAPMPGPLDPMPSGSRGVNINPMDSILFATPANNDRDVPRMTRTQRDSTGHHRRQGVSYSPNQHQSILHELLSTPPETSTASSSYLTQRADGRSPSNSRLSTVRLDQSGRITPDVLCDDYRYRTRRRSVRICPGRSRLDMLHQRPMEDELASSSSSSGLIGSDNSPVLPLEDVAGILSDLERNNSTEGLQSSGSRGLPTTSTAQPVNATEGGDVITISSDEVCVFVDSMCVHV